VFISFWLSDPDNSTLPRDGGSLGDNLSINFSVNGDTPSNNLAKLLPHTTFDHGSSLSVMNKN